MIIKSKYGNFLKNKINFHSTIHYNYFIIDCFYYCNVFLTIINYYYNLYENEVKCFNICIIFDCFMQCWI